MSATDESLPGLTRSADRLGEQIADLASAWGDPSAWAGTATAGTLTLPGRVLGAISLSELVVHAWDIAAAIGTTISFKADTLTAGGQDQSAAGSPRGAGRAPHRRRQHRR